MTAPAQSLTEACRAAARYIGEHGWTQGRMENKRGQVCLTGALKHCTPVPGDFELAREVHRYRGRGEEWNDTDVRDSEDVIGYLSTTEITNADLEEVFGPQWRVIVTVVRTIAAATDQQLEQLAACERSRAGRGSLDALQDAMRAEVRVETWAAARDAVATAAWRYDALTLEQSYAARYIACDMVRAVLLADAVERNGTTAEHITALAAPYISVFGEPEPVAS